ncbi:MAG: T9SS type A sorting domain-containing protein [Candidatus Marinimicrobia bacterium]|nr:T9SS type A sorting domain-containing protein [Candidatus Neomarinimicrobiota bacterium]
MRRMVVMILILLLVGFIRKGFSQWQPGQIPIMTVWGSMVTPENVHKEYPRPQLQRKMWKSLNGLWQFEFAKSEDVPWERNLEGEILVPFPVESALSGVMEKATNRGMWYKRYFTIPSEWNGKRVLLHFEAVDWYSKVYLNGNELGEHKGGYDSFSFDITSYIKDNNELILYVYDPSNNGNQPCGKQWEHPGGIWFTPSSGVWQTVWLEPVTDIYIKEIKITPDIDKKSVKIDIMLNKDEDVSVEVKVCEDSKVIASKGRRGLGEIDLQIPDSKLWSPDNPFLYGLFVTVKNENGDVDSIRSYFGMRKINILKDENGIARIFLNNRPVFLMGVLDQGFWPEGIYTAPSDEALKYDIEYAKKLGFNMIRKHVKVEPDRWYYWCDKLGMLVWQDMPNITPGHVINDYDKTQFKNELIEMVKEHFNYPSIVCWVIFNENWGIHDVDKLTDVVKSLDKTRLVNSNSGWNVGGKDPKVGDINDIHNYPLPKMPELEYARVAVCGEFGGLWRLVNGHIWGDYVPNIGFQNNDEITDHYTGVLMDSIKQLKMRGLSAVVYTEITDVEKEYAGLLTYDRKVEKFNKSSVYLNHKLLTEVSNDIFNKKDCGKSIKSCMLEQNYPNPFNTKTIIRYHILNNSYVVLNIYNMLGYRVANLVNKMQPAGYHVVYFDSNNLDSGVYFYELLTESNRQVRKMVLLK